MTYIVYSTVINEKKISFEFISTKYDEDVYDYCCTILLHISLYNKTILEYIDLNVCLS